MGRQDEVYVINAEDILDENAAGIRNGPRGIVPSPGSGEEGGRPAARARRGGTLRSNARAFIASTLSLFVWGAGQAYNGQFGLGILVLLGSVLVFPYFLGIWGAAHKAGKIAAAGGREGRGGFAWVLIQAMLGANLLLFTLVLLTVTGVLP